MSTYVGYFLAAWVIGFVLGFKYRMVKLAVNAST